MSRARLGVHLLLPTPSMAVLAFREEGVGERSARRGAAPLVAPEPRRRSERRMESAQHYQEQARQARVRASQVHDANARQTWIAVAAEYEWLAALADRIT